MEVKEVTESEIDVDAKPDKDIKEEPIDVSEIRLDADSAKVEKPEGEKPVDVSEICLDPHLVKVKPEGDKIRFRTQRSTDKYHCTACAVIQSPRTKAILEVLRRYREKQESVKEE